MANVTASSPIYPSSSARPRVLFGVTKEKEYLIENLSTLLSSGMDIITALDAIESEIKSKTIRRVIEGIKEEIAGGSSIWRALEGSRLFPAQVIALVRIGESSGQLSDNLEVVAVEQQKERVFRSKLRSAMMYPLLVLTLAVIMGLGIAWFVLPQLATVFAQLKVPLPFITRQLINLGSFLGIYGAIVVPLVIIIVGVIIFILFFFSKTKFIGQALLLHLPLIKRLIHESELAYAGYILGHLLKAGLPVIESLDSVSKAVAFRAYQHMFARWKESISEGNSFQKSFALYKKTNTLIPRPVQQMIVVAERSSRLPETLIKIGELYEDKLDETTKNLTVILEPLLLFVVWLGVVGVALAIIMPVYGLIGGFNG